MQDRATRIELRHENEKRSSILLSYENICEVLLRPEVWIESQEHNYIDDVRKTGTWFEDGTTRKISVEHRAFPTIKHPYFAYTCTMENVSPTGCCLSHDSIDEPLKIGQLVLIEDNTGHTKNWGIGEIRWTNNDNPAKIGVQIFGFKPELFIVVEVNFKPVKPIFLIAVKIVNAIHQRYVITKSNEIATGDYLDCETATDFFRVNDLIRNSNYFQCFRAGYGRIGDDKNRF